MAFGNFSFKRKEDSNPGVSEETYPRTKKIRNNRQAIETNARKSAERFDAKFEQQLNDMFRKRVFTTFGKRYEGSVQSSSLSEEEKTDIKNFIKYASRRLAAGAVSSPMFHKEILRNKPGNALDELAPPRNVGHDSMHAMMAYARTGGKSLVPAYMKLDDQRKLVFEDSAANLEEDYVIAFSELDDMAKRMIGIRDMQALAGEALVQATIESWENDHTKNFKKSDPAYPKANRLPEFETIVRNLLRNIEQEKPDPKFAVHEFQRILKPLLERLRAKPSISQSDSA